MSKKDLVTKKIEDYNEVFADIYNTLLFRKSVIVPERLQSGSTESIYKTDNRDLHSQSRDILKRYRNKANLVISSLGIENQASIDATMPIRIMGYDAGTYRQQLHEKEPILTPVITIVLNMTDRQWNAAKSLHELLHIDAEIAPYVQDYQIYVFDIAFLEDEVIESFQSDFKEIAWFFKKKRLGENPLGSRNELEHPREIMEFIAAFTHDERYLKGIAHLECEKQKGGGAKMCEVIDAIWEEGMQRGIEQGITQGIAQGMQKGVLIGKVELLAEMEYPLPEIAARLNISEERVEEILQN